MKSILLALINHLSGSIVVTSIHTLVGELEVITGGYEIDVVVFLFCGPDHLSEETDFTALAQKLFHKAKHDYRLTTPCLCACYIQTLRHNFSLNNRPESLTPEVDYLHTIV